MFAYIDLKFDLDIDLDFDLDLDLDLDLDFDFDLDLNLKLSCFQGMLLLDCLLKPTRRIMTCMAEIHQVIIFLNIFSSTIFLN